MLKNWKTVVVLLSVSLAVPLFGTQCAEAKENSKAPKNSKAVKTSKASKNSNASKASEDSIVGDKDDAVRSVLIKLETAICSKNVESTAQLFADEISFIDQSGEETRGRAALRERFEQLFKQATATAIGIHPQSITFPAENVALIVGEVSRKHEKQDLPASRFSMVLAKKNNAWQINQMTETTMQASQTENRLQELNWLIGDWSADKTDVSARMNVEWAPSRKFITSKTTIKKGSAQPQVDTQVIGWDPQHNTIISWHFDSNGGFGSGTWNKVPNEDKWTVDVAGVGADGSNTTASNVFAQKTSDQFVWQSIHRSLDGAAIADSEAITVNRDKR